MQVTWNNKKSKVNFSLLFAIPRIVPSKKPILAAEVHLKSEHQSCRWKHIVRAMLGKLLLPKQCTKEKILLFQTHFFIPTT